MVKGVSSSVRGSALGEVVNVISKRGNLDSKALIHGSVVAHSQDYRGEVSVRLRGKLFNLISSGDRIPSGSRGTHPGDNSCLHPLISPG